MKTAFRFLLLAASLGLIAGLTAGFFGFAHPAFDTIAHFRWHIGLGLLGLALLALALQLSRAATILLIFAAIGIWWSGANNRIGNELAEAGAAVDPTYGAGVSLSLLQFNLRFDNPQRDEVIEMLLASNADILMLGETSRFWKDTLKRLEPAYPHRFHCPEWNAIGGSMIFSKLPMRNDRNYCHAYAAAGFTEFEVAGEWVETGIVHLRWPWPASGPEQLEALIPRLSEIGPDAIVAGDFNATTWSHVVRRFADAGGLEVATGFGGTWMYKILPGFLAPFFGLPIDNVMAKGRMRVVSVQTLPAIGSDHLPVLTELRWEASEGQGNSR